MKNYKIVVENNLASIYWKGKLVSLGFGIDIAIQNITSKVIRNQILTDLGVNNQKPQPKCTTKTIPTK